MDRADAFDPLTVPKVNELLREVDMFGTVKNEGLQPPPENGTPEDAAAGRKVNDWEKTSLKPYVELFDGFVKAMMKSEMVRVKRERDEDGITGTDGMEF
jgi:DNA primase small subunit